MAVFICKTEITTLYKNCYQDNTLIEKVYEV